MSDASLPNTTLRQRFDAFIAANTHKKASETDFRRKGSLGVGLIITDTLMSKPPSFPLNPDDFLADAGTQVKNLSGSKINKILKAHGIDKSLGTEVGRTNRGAPQHMRVYIEFLNTLQAGDALDAPANMQWLTVADHKAKTRREARLCRAPRPRAVPVGVSGSGGARGADVSLARLFEVVGPTTGPARPLLFGGKEAVDSGPALTFRRGRLLYRA